MITYRMAVKSDFEECASITARAFESYSFFNMFIDDEAKRMRFAQALLTTGIKTSFRRHTIPLALQDGTIAAVGQLEAPDERETNLLDYVAAGGIRVLLDGGIRNTFGWLRMYEEAVAACRTLQGSVWYLASLAVSPAFQGQGVGSRMISECIIPHVALRGGGILCLITNSEENRTFYRKNGFTEFDERTLARSRKTIGSWSYRMDIPSVKQKSSFCI